MERAEVKERGQIFEADLCAEMCFEEIANRADGALAQSAAVQCGIWVSANKSWDKLRAEHQQNQNHPAIHVVPSGNRPIKEYPMSHIRVLICRVDDLTSDQLTELAAFDLPAADVAALQPATALEDFDT